MGVPRRKGGSRLSLQSFLAEKAKKGFPLQPLTQATQKSEKFQLNQSIIFLHSGQAVVANDNKNQRIPEIRDKPAAKNNSITLKKRRIAIKNQLKKQLILHLKSRRILYVCVAL